tara:strand:+ start:552 stop:950 length:399 start_codon:yes stop_codon:yes gene_type:complete
MRFLIFLISLISINVFSDTSYFKCEAKDGYILDEQGYRPFAYKKGERFESLTINRKTKLVSWQARTFEFIEDHNKDNIYEMDLRSDFLSISLRFNGVTGMLKEDIFIGTPSNSGSTSTKVTYECKKTTPIFD